MPRNIDANGREHRYRLGRVLLGGVLLVAGLFVLLEARMGWSALRALGFKTRV